METKFNQKLYIQEYKKQHYKQFNCDLPIELSEKLNKKLKELNITKKQFLVDAINDLLNKK